MLNKIINLVLPELINIIEIIGILILTVGTFRAFYYYVINLFKHKGMPVKLTLTKAMMTSLEFKMAAEILKTVIVQSMQELLIVGCIIFLRALMSVLLHYDMKSAPAYGELEAQEEIKRQKDDEIKRLKKEIKDLEDENSYKEKITLEDAGE